ncbi:MAG: recombination regulator RecX [Nevskia sp.]
MARRGRDKTPLEPAAARSHALRALGRREHSARELEHKLTRAGLEDEAAGEVVQGLGEEGWQSDQRYAELVVHSRISQGYGPLRISAELSARGVDDALIRAALANAACDWSERLLALYQRRYHEPASTPKEHASRYRFLASRGFTSSQIRAVLKHAPEAD